MSAGHGVGSAVGRNNSRSQGVRQLGHLFGGHTELNPAAGYYHWPLGRKQDTSCLVHQVAVPSGAGLSGAVGLRRQQVQLQVAARHQVAGNV